MTPPNDRETSLPAAEVLELPPGTTAPARPSGRRSKGAAGVRLTGAVTPVRIDVGPSSGPSVNSSDRTPGVGLVPSGDGGPVALRSALDWFTTLCRRPVSPERWAWLCRAADLGCVERVTVEGAEVVPLEWRRLGVDLVGKSEAGFRLLLRAPARVGEPPAPRAFCVSSGTTRAGAHDSRHVARLARCASRALTRREVTAWALAGQHLDAGALASVPVDAPECADLVWSYCCRPELTAPAAEAPADDGEGRPLEGRTGADRREVYGVELQIQGSALSAADSGGGGLVARLWGALAAHLWRDVMGGERAWQWALAWIDPHTCVGRVDVATDVAFTAEGGEAWPEWAIFAHGNHDPAFGRWSTKARSRRSEETVRDDHAAARAGEVWAPTSGRRVLLGKAVAGRTLYSGGTGYALLCVYERSKKRDGDWKLLERTFKRCGWDGHSLVIRAEGRLSRAWMRDQVVRAPDGSPRYVATEEHRAPDGSTHTVTRARTASELTVSEWLESLPVLARRVVSGWRHTAPGQTCRVRDRVSSPWWRAVEDRARAWEDGGGVELGAIVSVRREASLGHTITRLRSGLARLIGLRIGAHDPRDVWPELLAAWRDPKWREARDKVVARTRERYLLEHPAAGAELEARAEAARARARWEPLGPEELEVIPPEPQRIRCTVECGGRGCWVCQWDHPAATG